MFGVEDKVERWDFTRIGDRARVDVHYDLKGVGNGTLEGGMWCWIHTPAFRAKRLTSFCVTWFEGDGLLVSVTRGDRRL